MPGERGTVRNPRTRLASATPDKAGARMSQRCSVSQNGAGDAGEAALIGLLEGAAKVSEALPEAVREVASAAAAEIAAVSEIDVAQVQEKVAALADAAEEQVRESMGKAGKALVGGVLLAAAAGGAYVVWVRRQAAAQSEAGAEDVDVAPEDQPGNDPDEVPDGDGDEASQDHLGDDADEALADESDDGDDEVPDVAEAPEPAAVEEPQESRAPRDE